MAAIVLVGLLGACGDDASTAPPATEVREATAPVDTADQPSATVVLEVVDGEPQAVADAIEDRLIRLGLPPDEVAVDGATLTITGPVGPDGPDALVAAAAAGTLGFRPVLEVLPPTQDTATTTAPADGAEVLPQLDPASGEVVARLHVGPTALTGAAVESAEATFLASGQWAVALVLWPEGGPASEGIAEFNQLADTCVELAASCPTGQLAVVVDGVVVSAPAIQERTFERDQIQISGLLLDEPGARALAAALDAGPLPGTVEVVSVDTDG